MQKNLDKRYFCIIFAVDFGKLFKKSEIRRQTFYDAREISPLSPPYHAEITRKSPPLTQTRVRICVGKGSRKPHPRFVL